MPYTDMAIGIDGIPLLRKRIWYLKTKDLPYLDRSRETFEPDRQIFKDRLAELDRLEIRLEELLAEKEKIKGPKKVRKTKSFFKLEKE